MKTTTLVLLGLLAVSAIAVPVATAHVVYASRGEDGQCHYTVIGVQNLPPHAAAFTDGCRIFHTGTILP